MIWSSLILEAPECLDLLVDMLVSEVEGYVELKMERQLE